MNENILAFVKANKMKKRQLIRCGFELETQRTDGLEESDSEIDEDAYMEAVDSLYEERINELPASLSDWIGGRAYDSLSEDIRESASNDTDSDDYYKKAIDLFNDRLDSSYKIEVGIDGSVDGFEFRTKGALTYIDFMRAANYVFGDFEHEIDEKCSFHIHLSIEGVKHLYGARFQAALVEYITDNRFSLPENVKNRIENAQNNEFICGIIEERKKYCFVRNHDFYNTWEFRCFGHVESASEAKKCLDLAIDAMNYAYQACFFGEKIALDKTKNSQKTVYSALQENKTIKQILREERKLCAQ